MSEQPEVQQQVPKLTLTINRFAGTQEGQLLIEQQIPFCLGGQLRQGYKGALAHCNERNFTDEELRKVYDVDQTMHVVWAERERRIKARIVAKEQELAERKAKQDEKRKNELELKKLEQEFGDAPVEAADQGLQALIQEMQQEIKGLKQQLAAQPKPQEVTTDGILEHAQRLAFQCDRCKKMPPEDHKKPMLWLRGHKIHCKKKGASE